MAYRYRVMFVYIAGLSMTILDATIVNVALPKMADDFGVPTTEIEWIAIAYLLALAAVLPVAGWLGDRFGTKRVFVTSLVTFTLASLLCAAAPSLGFLIAARVLQGLAAGMVTPVGSAMLFRAFPLAERATATIGVISVAVVAPAIGPVLGGVIVDNASWHWIFLINAPVGVAASLLAIAWLREEVQDDPGRLDVGGLALSAVGLSLLVYALSTGPENGWLSLQTVGAVIIGVAALVGLVAHETRVDEPMLKLELFRDRLFRTINLAAIGVYSGFFGWIFLLPLYVQSLRGLSATTSGLVQAPQAAGIVIVSNLLGRRLYRSVGPRRLMVAGTLGASALTMACVLFSLQTSMWIVAGVAFARGLSAGMVFVSIQTAVYATISVADTGRAASLYNTQRQVSYASGVALAATVLATRLSQVGGETASKLGQLSAFHWAFGAMALLMIPGAILSWFVPDEDAAATRGLEPAPG